MYDYCLKTLKNNVLHVFNWFRKIGQSIKENNIYYKLGRFFYFRPKTYQSKYRIVKYADDLSVLSLYNDTNDDNLQLEFDNIISWSANNGMVVNSAKTKLMNVSFKKSASFTRIIDNSLRQLEIVIYWVSYSLII